MGNEETVTVEFYEFDVSERNPSFQEVGRHICSTTMSYGVATSLPMVRSNGIVYRLSDTYYLDLDAHRLVRFGRRIDGTFPIIGIAKVALPP